MNTPIIRTIIVDDETHSRETISEMIKIYCTDVRIVDQADSVRSGVLSIRKHKPDLVLLDIKMPDGTGFDLVRQMEQINFKIIFITAYEEYAIKAFKFSALDYLLKPIDPEELTMAVEKARNLMKNENLNQQINEFLTQMNRFQKYGTGKKIVLKTSDNLFVVDTNDIISVESDENYCHFHLVNNENILVSRSIKEYIKLLEEHTFYRAHKSYAININHVKRYNRDENSCVMSDGSVIPVSYRKKDKLFDLFKNI